MTEHAAARHRWRRPLRGAGWLLALGLALIAGYALYALTMLPPLQRWHTERLQGEFSAARHAGIDFAAYQRLEQALFDEMRQRIAGWPHGDAAFADSRFNPEGEAMRLAAGAPLNRSFRLVQPKPRGQALLVHGLTDSPYMMRAVARVLHAAGFDVTVLRLPGHGTLPSMMTTMASADWRAAVAIAARDVAARAGSTQPFYAGGFSTGGTLVLLHALEALSDPALPLPSRLLLFAPAIQLTPVANLTEVVDVLAVLPLPALDKVRWQEILPEYDPYKFNSFPVNAALQINRLVHQLQGALERAQAEGLLARLPPVLAWQSVVDATVGFDGVADALFGRLSGGQHRLVVFDVNRDVEYRSLLRADSAQRLDRLRSAPRGWTLDIVGNAEAQDDPVQILRLAADGTSERIPTTRRWPAQLLSLGHLALTLPDDDPVYGIAPGSGHAGVHSIGSWLLRGESGASLMQLGALTRVRSNPFWPLIEADLAALARADAAKR